MSNKPLDENWSLLRGEEPRATVTKDENGQVVLHDPDAVAMVRGVAKADCRNTLELNADRVEHFTSRAKTLGRTADEVVVVLLNVDDPNGAALADALMPGHDWQAIRDRGEVPFARGLAGRDGIQDVLDEIDPDAAKKLRTTVLSTKPSVVVVDHGVAEVF